MPTRSQYSLAVAKTTIFVAAFLISFTHSYATGAFDPTFGTNGKVTTSIGDQAFAAAAALQSDGKIIVAGNVTRLSTGRDVALVRYNPDGSLDMTFGNGGKVVAALSARDELIFAVALQPDGKIVVAGNVQAYDGLTTTDFLVARFNSNGTPDNGFGSSGAVTVNQNASDFFRAVVVQPDGKIIAAGGTSDEGGRAAMFRFNTNGTLDATFGNGGVVFLNMSGITSESFQALVLRSNGRILAGGRGGPANPVDPQRPNFIVEFNSNGTQAADFGAKVYSTGNGALPGYDLTELPDGKIVTVGEGLFRFSSDGVIEGNSYPCGDGIVARSDGKFIIHEKVNVAQGLALFTNTGRWIGTGPNLPGADMLIQPDDKILVVNSTSTDFVVTRLVAVTSQGTRISDFDSDGIADIAVYRSSTRTTYFLLSSNSSLKSFTANTDVTRVIPERYSGDLIYWEAGATAGSPAFFHYINYIGPQTPTQWGVTGDIPVGGDYYGHQDSQLTVFRPSNGTWYILRGFFQTEFQTVKWGMAGDKPVPADYDYDGITDIAVYRPSNGTWYILRSSDGGMIAQQFGLSTDIPLTGDFDGDGRADFVVYRPSNGTWYLLQTSVGFRAVQFGISTDQPVPGDYDGDGRHDIAVFRQGNWYILGSTRGFYAVQWGLPSDEPVAVRYAY